LEPESTERGDIVEWLFGPFRLSPSRGDLSSGGSEVLVARKSYELLLHLVRNRGRIVSREELRERVWAGTAVSESAVRSTIRDLRRALGDTGAQSRFVETIRGRGIRFVHEVSEVAAAMEGPQPTPWDTAAIHFERALQALEQVDASRGQAADKATGASHPRERGELIVALARARWSAGATEVARAAFLEAVQVARRSGDAEILARAALGFVGRSDVTPGVNREAASLLEESLEALPAEDSALRAELLARLGTELYYDEDPSRSDPLTKEALEMAERVGDKPVTAYVCTARHFACQRPDIEPAERLPLADRAISMLDASSGSDVLAFALQERLLDLFELGDGDAFDATFESYERVVAELSQPFFSWLLSMFHGTRAMLRGEIEQAEQLAHTTLGLGKRLGTPNADGVFAGQLFSIRREQGPLAELALALDSVAQANQALPIFRAGRAAVAAVASKEEAEAALEAVMSRDLEDLPRDQNWIATLGTLAPAAVVAQSEKRIRQLLTQLTPYAGRMIVVGQGAATHGAVSHHLGLLHAAVGENDVAAHYLGEAIALHRRARAPLWLEHSERALETL
jgi:DNA-binding winged helix-turn-helix (wHTH) protein